MNNITSAPNHPHPYLPPIPENWDYVKLGSLIRDTKSKGGVRGGIKKFPETYAKSFTEGFPYIMSDYIKGNTFIEYGNEISRIDTNQILKPSKPLPIFEPGSLFITRTGENAGRASMIREHAVAHEGIIMAYFDPEKVHGEYVYWWLKTQAFQITLAKLSGGVAQQYLDQEDVKNIEIPLPYPDNFPESRKIQDYILKHINALISEVNDAKKYLEKMNSDTNLLLDATLNEIFNNGKQSWPHKLAFNDAVQHPSKKISSKQLEQFKHLQHIGGADIEKETCRLLNKRTLEQTKEKSGSKRLFSNAVLYQKPHPELRKVVYIPGEGTCSQDIIPFQIRPGIQLIPRFLMWFLASPYFYTFVKKRLEENADKIIPRMNLSDFETYDLYFPDIKDQEQIVNRLDYVQKQVGTMQTILEEEKELLKQLEFSILDRAFRGEL